ncbi:hypothetical protein UFOVP707_89 [uncultured Caudovirales phage]|uniref:Uncharacterized protein n=1 Tax=uncultured Caudovirales phage TaxID=2100421 RepID=A0A6J5NJ36_9CAUD|nr:hypothetical protein UFOVP707_89 [uncultured Caudovirales phage]
MPTYTARLSHHSVRAQIHTLKATDERAAKAEARKLLGDGFLGHYIYLEELFEGERLPVAFAEIGKRGWRSLTSA